MWYRKLNPRARRACNLRVGNRRSLKQAAQENIAMSTTERLYLNGINALTGEYLVPPMNYDQAAATVKGEQPDMKEVSLLRRIWRVISQPHLGLPIDSNPEIVKQAGWDCLSQG
jgi:hypothetical protein